MRGADPIADPVMAEVVIALESSSPSLEILRDSHLHLYSSCDALAGVAVMGVSHPLLLLVENLANLAAMPLGRQIIAQSRFDRILNIGFRSTSCQIGRRHVAPRLESLIGQSSSRAQ